MSQNWQVASQQCGYKQAFKTHPLKVKHWRQHYPPNGSNNMPVLPGLYWTELMYLYVLIECLLEPYKYTLLFFVFKKKSVFWTASVSVT